MERIILAGALLVLALVVNVEATSRITTVEGYPLEWLREPQPGTPYPEANFLPTPVPHRPLSMRVLYRRLGVKYTGYPVLVVGGNGLNNPPVAVKLIDPNAQDCRAAAFPASNSVVLPVPTGYPVGASTKFQRHFELPVDVEYPHEHLMPWICVCINDCSPNNGQPGGWIHTNLRLAVVPSCDGDATSQATSNTQPLDLCHNRAAQITPSLAFGEVDDRGAPSDRSLLFLERKRRTVCCGWRDTGLTDFGGNSLQKTFGMCINPDLESCCSRRTQETANSASFVGAAGGTGKPYNKFREKCCYGGNITFLAETAGATQTAPEPVVISYLDDYCPCNKERQTAWCNQQIPSTSVQQCCTKTKYPELIGTAENQIWGKCYDGNTMRCCDTGDIYDGGSKQCCSINGVQSVNVPCPCATDSQCGKNQTCCMDTSKPMFPTPLEANMMCNKYVNYPNGTGPYEAQPCIGQCIDSRFQICCNGMACIDKYETCCNNTCCNRFNQRCTQGLRSGARGQWSNRLDFMIPFEVCTTIEAFTPFRAGLAIAFPAFLTLTTFVGLTITLFFSKRPLPTSLQPMTAYEKSMFALACFVILFSWPIYFSPLYKYGIVVVFACFFTILASFSQLKVLNVSAIVVVLVTLVYLIDPFYGNELLTLSFERSPPPQDSVHGYSGVLSSISMMAMNGQKGCTDFYDFFGRDMYTEDQLRWDNPEKATFGLCSRGWFVALGVFMVISIFGTFLLFFVTLLTHIRNVLFYKAQKTDEIAGWY